MSRKSQIITPGRINCGINAARQVGLSLIELMIAITLGLLIMTALITLFVDTSRTNREMAKVNAQIENGRFAIQLIQNDIIHGGFWGGYVPDFDNLTGSTTVAPTDVPTAAPDPCLAYSTPWGNTYKANLIGIPIQAYEVGSTVPTPPISVCNAVIPSPPSVQQPKANTDIFIIRHAATCLPGEGNCEADTAGKLYFQYSQCEAQIAAGNHYVLDTTNFTLTKRDCTTTADKRKFISNIYFVRNYAISTGDGIPTLMRAEFDLESGTLAHKTAEPLINGIEAIRIEFGIDNISDSGINIINDTDVTNRYTAAIKWADSDNLNSPTNRGDGIPDEYIRCPAAGCTADQLTHVVAAKLYVLARSEQPTIGYKDNKTYSLGDAESMCSTSSTDTSCALKVLDPSFKRHVFSTTIRLNNVSGRRETP